MTTQATKTDKVRILLVDDHPLIRTGMNIILSDNPQYMVIGGAADGLQALKDIEKHSPDVVFMDINMPSMDGFEATKCIAEKFPDTKVIILSMNTDESSAVKAFRAGAKGYVLKNAHHSQMLAAIEKVLEGGLFVSPGIAHSLLNGLVEASRKDKDVDPFDTLTRREKEILGLICGGFKNKEIADKLCISLSTVKTHRANIMEKLNIRDVAGLIKIALRKGICKD